ncbi:MAG: hypothetical protein NWE94_07545 [Candidatus Bathyarchaeota archaeon]|nr:hypothetical protein [Candidatus Bathyarchaeota archaeon]
MAVCPNCGAEVPVAVKSWHVRFRKGKAHRASPDFYFGIFECPACRARFRSRVEDSTKPAGATCAKSVIERIGAVQAGLTRTLRILRERMRILETERAGLIMEIEELKKGAELRVDALEGEVKQLREELLALKELLGAVEQAT